VRKLPLHRQVPFMARQGAQKNGVEDAETHAPCGPFGQLLPQQRDVAAEHIHEIDDRSTDLADRCAQKRPGAERGEVELDSELVAVVCDDGASGGQPAGQRVPGALSLVRIGRLGEHDRLAERYDDGGAA
jgi:hypothetical protein